jgi:hypothetical protein
MESSSPRLSGLRGDQKSNLIGGEILLYLAGQHLFSAIIVTFVSGLVTFQGPVVELAISI